MLGTNALHVNQCVSISVNFKLYKLVLNHLFLSRNIRIVNRIQIDMQGLPKYQNHLNLFMVQQNLNELVEL